MRITSDCAATDISSSARRAGTSYAGERIHEREDERVIAIRAAAAAFNSGITRQRQINTKRASFRKWKAAWSSGSDRRSRAVSDWIKRQASSR